METVAEFAVKTKNPGDLQDYRVLACSRGGLSVEDFEKLFKDLSVGTIPPPTRTTGECPPPWVTVGGYNAGGKPYLVVIRQEWTDRTDGRQRPIAAMSCLCVPYEFLAVAQAGLCDIYRQIPSYQVLLQRQPTPVSLLVETGEEALKRTSDLIEEMTYDFAAGVAALLIESPVAIVKGQEWNEVERLARLDAIASLLPYGCRAELTISTWMQSASMHQIRLGFSDAAGPRQKRVIWGVPPAEEDQPSAYSSGYYMMLRDLRTRYSIYEIVRFLARQGKPQTFARSQPFLDVLQELDRPYLVWRAVTSKRATPGDVRRVFQERKTDSLAESQRRDLLVYLLKICEQDDLEILREHWQPDLWDCLCQEARACLEQSPSRVERLEKLAHLALQIGKLADFLEFCLVQAATLAGSSEARLHPQQTVVHMLFAMMGHLDRYDAQRVRDLLLKYPLLLYEFIIRAGQDHPEMLARYLDWLEYGNKAAQATLRTFRIAGGMEEEDATDAMLDAVARVGGEYVRGLLRIALNHGRLPRLLPAAVSWLGQNLSSLSRERQEWLELLTDLDRSPLPLPQTQAQIDLLHLAFELYERGPLPFFEKAMAAPQREAQCYMAEFARYGPIWRGEWLEIVRRLLARSAAWRPSAYQAENMLDMLDRVVSATADGTIENQVCGRVFQEVETYPELLQHPLFVERWRDRLQRSGYSAKLAKLALGTNLEASVPLTDVVDSCARILRSDGPAAMVSILEQLKKRSYLKDIAGLNRFWAELCQQLEPHLSPDKLRRIEQTLFDAILSGEFGSDLARDCLEELFDNASFHFERIHMIVSLLQGHLSREDREAFKQRLGEIQGVLDRGRGGLRGRT